MEQTVQSTKQWTETKAERKARKARYKAGLVVEQSKPVLTTVTKPKNYVVCLKWGDKYSADYVNKLYNMVDRNITIDYEFVCFTDDLRGIDSNIKTITLQQIGVSGWWYKPMFFNPELVLQGTVLFIDLDVIIFRNIDKLFTYQPGRFCVIRDFNRKNNPSYAAKMKCTRNKALKKLGDGKK